MNADHLPDDLDRLWRATRPVAPSAEAWDHVWASVSARIDDPPAAAPATLAMPSRRRGWAAVGVVLTAQAAAVLLAVGLALSGNDPKPDAADVSHTATASIRIEEGQLVLIRSDADAVQVADLTPEAGPAGVDAWYIVYNLLESLAGPFVAMSE